MSRPKYITIPRDELSQLVDAAKAWGEHRLGNADVGSDEEPQIEALLDLCTLWGA